MAVFIECHWHGVTCGVFASVTNTTTLTATIVASSCVGEILTLNSSGRAAGNAGTVDFGVINPKSRAAPVRQFSLRLSEVVGGKRDAVRLKLTAVNTPWRH